MLRLYFYVVMCDVRSIFIVMCSFGGTGRETRSLRSGECYVKGAASRWDLPLAPSAVAFRWWHLPREPPAVTSRWWASRGCLPAASRGPKLYNGPDLGIRGELLQKSGTTTRRTTEVDRLWVTECRDGRAGATGSRWFLTML